VILRFGKKVISHFEIINSPFKLWHRYLLKVVAYGGEIIGELFDFESDPGEFVNLWDDPHSSALKSELVLRHFKAHLATSSAGARSTKKTGQEKNTHRSVRLSMIDYPPVK
jgi:hypothetical protein